MVGDVDLSAEVVKVLADAVGRVLASLERGSLRKGSIGVDDGSASWELDSSIRADLYFTDKELTGLRETGPTKRPRAFSGLPS